MHEDTELAIRWMLDGLRKDTDDILSGVLETPMEYHTPAEGYSLLEGMVMRTHPRSRCAGDFCSVHNPSDHPLKDAPREWRSDKNRMDRVCTHGVSHPDPDDLAYFRRIAGGDFADSRGVHGCCMEGCCGTVSPIIDGEVISDRREIEG